jgi:hypothetical protein
MMISSFESNSFTFSSQLLMGCEYHDVNLVNGDRAESWLAPNLSLDVVTPPVLIKDRSLSELSVIMI